MSNIEDLVPPLELCNQIPEGKFENSLLVYAERFRNGLCLDFAEVIMPRVEAEESDSHRIIAPAPTLAEIVEALYKEAEGCCQIVNCFYDKEGWGVVADYECHDDSGYGSSYEQTKDPNPATAALKLWLKAEGVN